MKYLLIILPAALRWFAIFFAVVIMLPESFYIAQSGGVWAQGTVACIWLAVAWNALVVPSLFAVFRLYKAIIQTHKTAEAKEARKAISRKVIALLSKK